MDLKKAVGYAQLVNVAYGPLPTDLTSSAGKTISDGVTNYTVVTTLYANDLATDINPSRGNDVVSIGLVCQAVGAGDVVIAIRGTEGIQEWIHDAEFLQVACPFLATAGRTEDGFTAMYNSLSTGAAAGATSVIRALGSMAFPQPVSSLTICGHSLGASIATLLALDVAANATAAAFKNPTVYTYASPRTGNSTFATTYDKLVKTTYRIANRVDIVPKMPMPPSYEHVLTSYEVNPVQFLPFPPRVLVKFDFGCEHYLNTYLYLLSLNAGGPVVALDGACAP